MVQVDDNNLHQTTTKFPIHTRRILTGDLQALTHIFNHYIANTVISFRVEPINVSFFEDVLTHKLPFIVASINTLSKLETETAVRGEKLIGYAYATPWRPNYPAYRHTVEISIYVHPEYVSVGVGSALMDELMAELRTTRVDEPTATQAIGRAENLDQPDETERIHQVLAIMALVAERRGEGNDLEKFYSRWGFERIGYMKQVGFKFGRWIDVLMLQTSL